MQTNRQDIDDDQIQEMPTKTHYMKKEQRIEWMFHTMDFIKTLGIGSNYLG